MNMPRRVLLAALPAFCASSARADEATSFLAESERRTGGRIGIYARNLATGRTLSWRADERFVMCSTFKMSLVACVLSRVDKGEERLGRFVQYGAAQLSNYAPVARLHLADGGMTVGAMCQAAIEVSDNTCADLLLLSVGGPAALTRFWRAEGDEVTRLDHTEPRLNFSPPGDPRDTTTPAAMAGDLQRFLLGDALSPASRARLTGWMLNCQTGGALLRAGLPKGWKVADKTGNNGKDALGDIAVAWPAPDRPIVICAYTQGGQPKPEILPPILAGVGRMVGAQLA
ncbi:class A beta-lactamase [Acidocella sp. MX-AZ02]|uniref:class A beta-lactamase n=2 Tax=unclassified Acidocella TaxID=2648610 RepID=UPI00028E593C|nr:class A beta-lactamase [Acidocella sp. MX-AZ02]EKM99406.1 Beta-lactamase [Acidocella sp. MX-AZ02]